MHNTTCWKHRKYTNFNKPVLFNNLSACYIYFHYNGEANKKRYSPTLTPLLSRGGGEWMWATALTHPSLPFSHQQKINRGREGPDFQTSKVEKFRMVVKINIFYIQHFHLDDNAPYLSSKFCITIVSNFSWVLQWSQEKSKTTPMQNLGG